MRLFITLVLLQVFSIIGLSQTVKVIDRVNFQPIENVFIFSNNNTALTNSKGEANISKFNKTSSITFQHATFVDYIITYKKLKENNFKLQLSESILKLNEIVIATNRWEEKKDEVPNKMATISAKEIAFANPQTAADLLGKSDEIFIQKSQMGGGSPMIRGFATNRILIVVDGVRMNNAIYRSGNLQNVISIDANAVERMEVIFGPGSVMYGSDAIGGVLDFHTYTPKLSTKDKLNLGINALTRYSTVNNEKTGHIDLNVGSKKLGSFTSITYSNFSDLKMGTVGNNSYTRTEYVDWINKKDSIVKNDTPNIQKFSGYSQINLMQKLRFRPNKKWDINYGFHFSELSNVPRYDRLIQYKNDKPRYAEWYYGPQKWMMNVLNIKYADSAKLFDKAKLTVAHQSYEESRYDRQLNNIQLRERTENVAILSANLDFDKNLSSENTVFYGIEAVTNKINSTAQKRNIYTDKIEPYASRYPNNSTYMAYAAYLNFKSNFNKKMTIISGLRYNRILINSVFDTTFYQFPFSGININTGALNGSIGFVYRPDKTWQLNINTSSGFRAPNIDDVGKVFDSEPGKVVVPNSNLHSEYAYNFELGMVKTINKRIKIDLTGFYTILKDAMVRRDFTFNGKDSIMYDGEMSKVQAIVNADEAVVYGVQFAMLAEVFRDFSYKLNVNYTKGTDGEGLPLRHVAPLFASSHLLFNAEKFKADLSINYNGEINSKNMSPSEQSKIYMYALDNNGNAYSPAWYTLNVNTSYQLNKLLQINFGVENLLDVRYRPYSSGIVAPGRNFIFGLRAHF